MPPEPTTHMSTPTSPNEMPAAFRNDAAAMLDLIRSLDQNDCVSIHWEPDVHASKVGEWEITIENGMNRVDVKHPEITNALWFATQVVDAKNGEAYQAQKATRAVALSKLTPEEKRLLNID